MKILIFRILSTNKNESGYVMLFIGIGLVALLGILSMAINTSYSRSIRTELQDATDSAAHAAASILCSTEDCYEDAGAIALSLLTDKASSGIIKEIDFERIGESSAWTNGEAKLTIHRGRWWPEQNMYNDINPFFHENQLFEDFDKVPEGQGSWQEYYPQLPNHFAANAVYVKAEIEYENTFLNVFKISNTKITTESYSVAGDVTQEVCVAPFALPICALLDNNGILDKQKSCEYERFFTEADRYCEDVTGDGIADECDIVPGALFRAIPKSADGSPDDYKDASYCFEDIRSAGFFQQEFEIDVDVRLTCDFRSSPSPSRESTSDFFGVVGMPVLENSLYNPLLEASYQSLLSSDIPCINAKIGDDFKILPSGLTALASEDVFRDRLATVAFSEEMFGSKYDVLYHSLLTKNINYLIADVGEPSATACNDPMTVPNPVVIHGERACSEPESRGGGLCNSSLFYYDSKCLKSQNIDSTTMAAHLYSENQVACSYDESSFLYENQNSNSQELHDPEDFLNSSPTWSVAVPIIAPKGFGTPDMRCAGVAEHIGKDPMTRPNIEYKIVGFTTVNFFDYDIGKLPPRREYDIPSSGVSADDIAKYTALNNEWTSNLWDATEKPWGLMSDVVSGGTECNMVKATQECDEGLLSIPQYKKIGDRTVRIVVPN